MTPQAALTALAVFCDRIEAEGGHRTELLQGVRGLLAEVDVIAGADEYSRGYADGRTTAGISLSPEEARIAAHALLNLPVDRTRVHYTKYLALGQKLDSIS